MARDPRAGGFDRGDDALRIAPVVVLVAVLVGVAQLPESTRRALSFEYGDPTLLTAYTAPFVHFSSSHLVGNVAVLLLAGIALAHLSRESRSPWLFVGALVVLASTVPVAVTLLNLAIPRNGVTYGFSGVNMALVGFLPVAVVRYVEWRLGRPVDAALLVAWFAVSTGYIAAIAVPPSSLSIGVTAASLFVAVAAAGRLVATERRLDDAKMAGYRLAVDPTVVVGVGVWIGLVTVGFPRVEIVDGTIPNVYVHFLGYALGFITAYLAHECDLVGSRT